MYLVSGLVGMFFQLWATARLLKCSFRRRNRSLCHYDCTWSHAVSNIGPKHQFMSEKKYLPVCIELLCEEETASQRGVSLAVESYTLTLLEIEISISGDLILVN